LLRAGRLFGAAKRTRELAESLLHAGASAEQRRAEDQPNCTPPGRAKGLMTRRCGFTVERAWHLSISWPTEIGQTSSLSKAGIQAYCRRIVNRTKGLWSPGAATGCGLLLLRRRGSPFIAYGVNAVPLLD